ncbi:MAG: diacylglycerol kinase [bacterium]|nr:diacylglycerol kinase [bacterium]
MNNFRRKKRSKSIVESFSNAVNGLMEIFYQERNMRIHLIIAVAILVLVFFVNLSHLELIVILFCIGLVFALEAVNTAIELISDKISKEYDEQIKVIKDVSAASVLIASILSVIIAYIIITKKFKDSTPILIEKLSNVPEYMFIFVFVLVLLLSMLIKVWYMRFVGRKVNVQGGLISVHAALAASTATFIIIHSWKQPYIILMAIVLALLVIQSRYEAKIHTLSELINGSLFGVIITLIILQGMNLFKI